MWKKVKRPWRAGPGAGLRSGITRRWARGSLLVIVLLLAVIEGMFLYSTVHGYYDGVQQSMYRRFSSINGQLKVYSSGTARRTAASRSLALRRMVEQFADKDKYEFMLLDGEGSVIASTSGTNAGGIIVPDDFEQAQTAPDGYGTAVYTTSTGEPVMSVCCLVPYAAEEIVAMRLVTSLTLIRRQVQNAVLLGLTAGAVALAIAAASGLYFVRSIVVPLGQVERAAADIARGDLDTRLPETDPPRDELDRLRGSINRMAQGLAETEKMKNEFISSVSHELRTPLTSIRGWVETLEALDDPGDANYRKGLEIIDSETGRLYSMVEELLDFSRLQNGGIQMDCRPLDLVAELTDALLFCEPRMRQEDLALHYAEPEEMIPVYADPSRLRQVAGLYQRAGQRHQVFGPRRADHRQAVGGGVQGLCRDHRPGPRHPARGPGQRQGQVLQGQQRGPGQRHRAGAGGFHHDRPGRHPRPAQHPGQGHGRYAGAAAV